VSGSGDGIFIWNNQLKPANSTDYSGKQSKIVFIGMSKTRLDIFLTFKLNTTRRLVGGTIQIMPILHLTGVFMSCWESKNFRSEKERIGTLFQKMEKSLTTKKVSTHSNK
jgi:hypothetical protein